MGLIIHVVGGSRGDPGPAGAGVVIQAEDDTLIHEGAYFLGEQTAGAAEYQALIRALARAQRCGEHTLCVCSDSQLLVQQVTGKCEIDSPNLIELSRQVQVLLLRVSNWSFFHIPPEENKRADELANLAMDQGRDVIVIDVEDGGAEVPIAPAASTAESSASESPPVPAEDVGNRAVRVVLAREPKESICPADMTEPLEFTVQSELPASLCIHAAHAIVTTLLAMLSTEPEEFATVPTLTVHCTRPGCGAAFHLSPVRSSNGKKRGGA